MTSVFLEILEIGGRQYIMNIHEELKGIGLKNFGVIW